MFLIFCSDWLNHNILCVDGDQSRLRGFCCTILKLKKKKTGCVHHQSLKLSCNSKSAFSGRLSCDLDRVHKL
jgi:hypothetical protein